MSFMEQDRLYSLIVDGNEVSWRTILIKTIKEEGLDPWDIDVSLLSKRFLETVKKLNELNLRISGKIILASALLLKLKSKKLIEDDVSELNAIFSSYEDSSVDESESSYEMDDYDFGFESEFENSGASMVDSYNDEQQSVIQPKTPLPRKRKVSIFELMSALQKALDVNNRRVLRDIDQKPMRVPEKNIDIHEIINNLFEKLKAMLSHKKVIRFSELLPEEHSAKDIFYTFLPLLHLDRSGKVVIRQDEPFGEIFIFYSKDNMNSE